MLGSPERIGKALGLQKCDVDEVVDPPTVQIRGRVVVRKGKGTYRLEVPKTDASNPHRGGPAARG